MSSILKRSAAALLSLALILTLQIVFPVKFSSDAAIQAVWPVDPQYKTITTRFDPTRNVYDVSGYHNGIDIPAPEGTPIYAAYAGTVVFSGWKDGYGYIEILHHPELNLYTFYGHCSALVAASGTNVSAGDTIAKVGNTGASYGAHLHFGICNTLQGGWPAKTFFDPASYFTYVDKGSEEDAGIIGKAEPVLIPDCSCSEEYAGIYTTKDVTTYLNVRSGHGTEYSAIGQIPAGAEVKVTKSDGTWAHVEYDGIFGFCSMEYLEKVSDIESSIKMTGASIPEGAYEPGEQFTIGGIITSSLTITNVWGGVYDANGEATSLYAEAEPDAFAYDITTDFSLIDISTLEAGSYTFRLEAKDMNGNVCTVADSSFTIGTVSQVKGDINFDGVIDTEDEQLLRSYLLKGCEFTKEQYEASDVNGDGRVDVFDLVSLRPLLTA